MTNLIIVEFPSVEESILFWIEALKLFTTPAKDAKGTHGRHFVVFPFARQAIHSSTVFQISVMLARVQIIFFIVQ